MTEPVEPAVLVERDGPVRILTLNRPGRRNSLDLDDRVQLLDALRTAEADPACRAVVLTGAGKIFCSGGDITSMTPDPELIAVRLKLVGDIARHLVTSPCPVVTAVEGGAYGLGLALATGSDFAVVAEDAQLTCSFARIGLTADTGLSYTLPARVGSGRAREMILLAPVLTAAEGLAIGLISEVVLPGNALVTAVERAHELAAMSAPMIAATKRLLAEPAADLDGRLAAEAAVQLELLMGADFAEGRAAFAQRRPPVFTAPRPGTSPPEAAR